MVLHAFLWLIFVRGPQRARPYSSPQVGGLGTSGLSGAEATLVDGDPVTSTTSLNGAVFADDAPGVTETTSSSDPVFWDFLTSEVSAGGKEARGFGIGSQMRPVRALYMNRDWRNGLYGPCSG